MQLIALLRGINVGGHRKVPMAALRGALADRGCEAVSTYIQSGNVVLSTNDPDPAGLVAGVIDETFGIDDVTVVIRTPEELRDAAERMPFAEVAPDSKHHHVAFLDRLPTDAAIAALDPNRSPPDRFIVDGREIYVHFPNGSGRSKLSLDWFERNLGVKATMRNWRTVGKLLAMTAGYEGDHPR